MKTIPAIIAALACLSVSGVWAETVVPAEKSKFHLFVLAGQSNMSGRGTLTATNRVPHDRVLVMSKDGTWREAVEPFHWEKPRACGAGLAASFARAYADAHPGVTVGLVPVAYGGSPISRWQPGAVHYTNAVHYAKLAMKDGVIKGVLWHQGSPIRSRPSRLRRICRSSRMPSRAAGASWTRRACRSSPANWVPT